MFYVKYSTVTEGIKPMKIVLYCKSKVTIIFFTIEQTSIETTLEEQL